MPAAFKTHTIRVDKPHILSVAEYGNPQGTPVVFLHGGPGSGCRAAALAGLFDLEQFRVVAPDQRGAGNSQPKGCREYNTTQHLIADLELIREQLDIEQWMVVGGSWGALLAVAYAQAHPQSVTGIVTRSFFFGDEASMQTAFIDNPKARFLELYKQFVDFLEPNECGTPQEILAAYYRRLLSADENERIPAVYMWHDYERALSTATPAVAEHARPSVPEHAYPSVPEHAYPSVAELVEAPKGAPRNLPTRLPARQPHPQPRRPLPSTPTMEAHYFSNNSFLPSNMLLDNAERLNGIKGVLVQGECDYLCPPDAAQRLSARWRDSEVVIVKGAGHNQTEPGIQDALRAAINKLS